MYAEELGEVEFVVKEGVCDPPQEWDARFPNGVMIATKLMGHVFMQPDDDDLEFVSRRE